MASTLWRFQSAGRLAGQTGSPHACSASLEHHEAESYIPFQENHGRISFGTSQREELGTIPNASHTSLRERNPEKNPGNVSAHDMVPEFPC